MPFVIVTIGFILSIIICLGEWLVKKPSDIDDDNKIDSMIDNATDELRKNVFALKGLISVKQDPSNWLDDFVIHLNNKTANKTD
jgi:hypothetical protein